MGPLERRNELGIKVKPKIEKTSDRKTCTAQAARLTGGLEAQLLISQGKVAPPHSGASRLKMGEKNGRTRKKGFIKTEHRGTTKLPKATQLHQINGCNNFHEDETKKKDCDLANKFSNYERQLLNAERRRATTVSLKQKNK
jgi:hypothetical protein